MQAHQEFRVNGHVYTYSSLSMMADLLDVYKVISLALWIIMCILYLDKIGPSF